MINITLNNKKITSEPNTTLKDLIDEKNFPKPFAIAINKTFIPQINYHNTILKQNDEIEIVIPMQGG